MKNRSSRLDIVAKLADEKEQACTLHLAGAQARLGDAESRISELRRYLKEYQQAIEQRARSGMGVAGVRDYQTFIMRIGEAVRQQDALVSQLRTECERARAQWRHAAVRKASIGKLLAKARSEARQHEERQQQKELDDRAQRLGGMR